jgi:GR25 family glycosyltransferase involved in LPS biosynthesis
MKNYFIITAVFIFILIILSGFKKIESFQNLKRMKIGTYIINLERSKRRMVDINNQCENAGLKFKRWNAYDGSKLNLNYLKSQNLISRNNKMLVGAIGCSLSHISLWKHTLQNTDNDYLLIIEDDCIIPKNFKEKLKIYMKQVPKNWDIIYLGGSNINGIRISKNILKPKILIDNSTFNTGTYCMLIKRRLLPFLLKKHVPISDNIDQTFKNKLFKDLNVYYVYPPLVTHNNEIDSDRRVVSNKKATTRWFRDVQNRVKID